MKSSIHHITAICSDPQKNFQFYTQVLGLRFVKKTVNFDDPKTYHLYYGNTSGEPGTALTFFPFEDAGTGMRGVGQVTKIQFAVPVASISFWIERLHKFNVKFDSVSKAFANSSIKFYDPDGLQLELVQTNENDVIEPWTEIIPEEFAIRGFFGAELAVDKIEDTKDLLINVFGYSEVSQVGFITRMVNLHSQAAKYIDLFGMKGWSPAISGSGTIHHIAFATENDDSQEELRQKVKKYNLSPTVQIDRKYFHSVYFREPNNILFEIATNEPGFTVDEDLATLGSSLKLPEQYEFMRQEIENYLPELDVNDSSIDKFSNNLELFKYKFIRKGEKVLVLFHGTGGDENDLINLGDIVNPDYSILSLRGNILEGGMRRFFERNTDGTFVLGSINTEAEKFNSFITDFIQKNDLKIDNLIYLGYSNGANFICSILFLNPELVTTAVLMHPMIPFEPDADLKLRDKKIIITSGENDPYLRHENEIQDLEEIIKTKGAKVEVFQHEGGHEIVDGEIEFIKNIIIFN
jgi:predicted esterase/catechol 2,3-dioxygenase-like lactoylglutathione lyase family enzyme